MKQENETILEEFDLWLKTRFVNEVQVKGHRFKKTKRNEILIDGGPFTRDEAKQILKMIMSRNPITRLNATLIIWERNGTLTKILIALAIIMLILIYIRIRK